MGEGIAAIAGVFLAAVIVRKWRKDEERMRAEAVRERIERAERKDAAAQRINKARRKLDEAVEAAHQAYSEKHREIERDTGFSFNLLPMPPSQPFVSGYDDDLGW